MMARRSWVLWVALVAVLNGCGAGGLGAGGLGAGEDRQRRQAREALDRYDKALREAGGTRAFVPVGELTGQLGTWEEANGDGKLKLAAGMIELAPAAQAETPEPKGKVVWDSGATETVPLLSAQGALLQVRKEGFARGPQDCGQCVPLEATGARLTTGRIETTRGPATVPIWEYTLKDTAVRITRVAVDASATVTVTPPSWDPYNAPGGMRIESAGTTRAGNRLTVTFTGAPDPASKPCGEDYTAEAVESANAVVVIVIAHPHAPNEMCNDIGATRSTTVDLAQPLGERAVLEVVQGMPVPVTFTG